MVWICIGFFINESDSSVGASNVGGLPSESCRTEEDDEERLELPILCSIDFHPLERDLKNRESEADPTGWYY